MPYIITIVRQWTLFSGMSGTLPPGSQLVFTYVHAGVLDGPVAFFGAKNLLCDVAELGEPWTFGLNPEKFPNFFWNADRTQPGIWGKRIPCSVFWKKCGKNERI